MAENLLSEGLVQKVLVVQCDSDSTDWVSGNQVVATPLSSRIQLGERVVHVSTGVLGAVGRIGDRATRCRDRGNGGAIAIEVCVSDLNRVDCGAVRTCHCGVVADTRTFFNNGSREAPHLASGEVRDRGRGGVRL